MGFPKNNIQFIKSQNLGKSWLFWPIPWNQIEASQLWASDWIKKTVILIFMKSVKKLYFYPDFFFLQIKCYFFITPTEFECLHFEISKSVYSKPLRWGNQRTKNCLYWSKSNQIKFLFYFCFREDDHALSKHLKNMFQAHGLKIKVNTKGKNTLFLARFLLYHNHTLLLTSSKNKWKSWLLLQNMRVWLSVCNMK